MKWCRAWRELSKCDCNTPRATEEEKKKKKFGVFFFDNGRDATFKVVYVHRVGLHDWGGLQE